MSALKVLLISFVLGFTYLEAKKEMTREEMEQLVKEVNNLQTDWKAALPYRASKSGGGVACVTGDVEPLPPLKKCRKMKASEKANLPENFDSREKWPDCPSISSIKNQGQCGSCYAVASSAVFSDRLCTTSNGKVLVNISVEYIITCCAKCHGSEWKGDVCRGGQPPIVLKHFNEHGGITGGDYESGEGCQPYTSRKGERPDCVPDQCTNEDYDVAFNDDLHYAQPPYHLETEEEIKQDIYAHGSVVTSFKTYQDFDFYKEGVYKHVAGNETGYHAVRIIGWGVTNDDNKLPYWLVTNSWGRSWGEQGIFKMHRGINDCGFENNFHSLLGDFDR